MPFYCIENINIAITKPSNIKNLQQLLAHTVKIKLIHLPDVPHIHWERQLGKIGK